MDFIFNITDYNIGVIYMITGPDITHKYIGQTKLYRKSSTKIKYFNYTGRFKEHIIAAKYNPKYHIDRIIKQNGIEKFSVKLIKYCLVEDLDINEITFIKKFDTLYPNGLNIVLGNPHKHSNTDRTSLLLKEYYSNQEVLDKHSKIHRSKFKDIDIDNIKQISIKPIKENNLDKIVYMYIEYNNNEIYRRRYGGKHENFNEAYNRCILDSKELIDESNIIDYTKGTPLIDFGEIILAELKIHKIKEYKLIALYITNKDVKKWDEKKRFVFGGKTISIENAYNKVVEFIKKQNININKIKIHNSLMATLPNCWNILRA